MSWNGSVLLLIARSVLRCEHHLLVLMGSAKKESHILSHNDDVVRLRGLQEECEG